MPKDLPVLANHHRSPRPDWGDDSSLFFRLQDAVRYLARGKGKYDDRMRLAADRLMHVSEASFPDEFLPQWRTLWAVWKKASEAGGKYGWDFRSVGYKERDLFNSALFEIYDAMLGDRALIKARKPKPD